MSGPKATWGFRPRESVDGYEIEQCLGGGSEYEVYAAAVLSRFDSDIRRQTDEERVVVKYVRPNLVVSGRSSRRLRREAELLQGLDHPNVPRLNDAAPVGPRPRLVLERVAGLSLKERLRKGPLSTVEVVSLGAALAGVLTHLAERDVVHLDVKPSNVMVGPRPALIDFSVARDPAAASRLTKAVGTDIWMSPEQCLPGERGPVGPAADVWGLGATLWRGLLGKPPFKRRRGYDRTDPFQRFPQLTTAPRALPAHVPAPVRAILQACLNMEPSCRPRAKELVDSLAMLQPVAA